jgi:anti-sigma regulatory factor (Ser/Thr protein kinase)
MRPPTPADGGGQSVLGQSVVSGSGPGSAVPGSPSSVGAGSIGAGPTGAGQLGSTSFRGTSLGPDSVAVASAGLLAAPVAEALAVLPDEPERLSDASLSNGGCFARPLPIDTTCAAAARRFFREAVSSLGIPSGLMHDGVTMASELAANTLHAQRNVALGAARLRAAGIPEIWLYIRGTGSGRELVCKVFDTERNWSAGSTPGMSSAPLDSVSGRGLQVVAGLSAGQWGCHLSRSRLGNWKVPGKAVWFSLRLPPTVVPDSIGMSSYQPDQLIDELEAMLAARGLSGIVRADMEDISVLSVSRFVTVWRHGRTVSWRTPGGPYERMDLVDLVDVAEHVVCAQEEAALRLVPA